MKGVEAGAVFMRQATGWLYRERWLGAVLLLALALRCWALQQRTVWFDEAFAVVLAREPVDQIWWISANDVHPPLYYLLLRAWVSMAGESVVAWRSLSVVFGVMAVALAVWLARLIAGRQAGLLAGLLMAVFPVAVRYSQEARMYALLMVWALGASIAFLYWLRLPSRRWPLAVYALCAVAGLYTHYFMLLTLLAHWVHLLVLRWRTVQYLNHPAWWLANALVVVLYLPWLPSLLLQVRDAVGFGWLPAPALRDLADATWWFLGFVRTSSWGLWVVVWLPLLLLVLSWRQSQVRDKRGSPGTLLALGWLVPMLLAWALNWWEPLFYPRYLLGAACLLPVVLALSVVDLQQHRKPWAALLLASWLALSLSGLVRVYGDGELFNGPSPAQVRVDALNAHIRQHFRAGDRVMTDDPYLWFTLQAYAPASGAVGVWHADVDTATGMLIDSQGMDIRTLATLPRSVCRFWFASHPDTPMEDPQLDHQWQMTEQVDFGDDAVWLFVRQPVADTCEGE